MPLARIIIPVDKSRPGSVFVTKYNDFMADIIKA